MSSFQFFSNVFLSLMEWFVAASSNFYWPALQVSLIQKCLDQKKFQILYAFGFERLILNLDFKSNNYYTN